jgi:hypothetical protein
MRTRLLLSLAFGVAACGAFPNHTDALGPREFVQRTQPEPRCDHLVELVDISATSRPYEEVSRLSVTCHPSARSLCERRLRERACALGADAVVLMDSGPDGTAKPPYSQSQVAQSGLAIRFR